MVVRAPFWLPIGIGLLALLSYVWGELNPPIVLAPWVVIPWWANGFSVLTILLTTFCIASFGLVWAALHEDAKARAAPRG